MIADGAGSTCLTFSVTLVTDGWMCSVIVSAASICERHVQHNAAEEGRQRQRRIWLAVVPLPLGTPVLELLPLMPVIK